MYLFKGGGTMRDDQMELLKKTDKSYLSLGISEDGSCRQRIPIPWQNTGTAFNMRLPMVWLEPDDLEDAQLMEYLESFQVRGMYIFTPLEDYSFISRFQGLWDVYICRGGGWIDISFMRKIPDWSMFYLCDAIIPDISPVFTTRREMIFKRRKVCLTNYRIDSSEDDSGDITFISELLIE